MPPYSKNKKEPSSHTETMVRGSTLLGTNVVPTHRITARHRTNLPIIGTLPPSVLAKKLVVEYFFQS